MLKWYAAQTSTVDIPSPVIMSDHLVDNYISYVCWVTFAGEACFIKYRIVSNTLQKFMQTTICKTFGLRFEKRMSLTALIMLDLGYINKDVAILISFWVIWYLLQN